MSDTAAAVARFMSERDQFARHLGIELVEIRPGYSRAEITLAPHMVNGLNMPHGGVIFSLADFAFAAACNSHGRAAVALSMDVHFIASPAPGSKLFAEAEEVHCGNRTGLYRMTVTDQDNKLIAELHGMAYRKDKNFLESQT